MVAILARFWKPKASVEQWYQTVLIGQKWVENAKMPKFKYNIFKVIFNQYG